MAYLAFFGRERCWVNGTGVWSSDADPVDAEEILYEGGDDPGVAIEIVTQRGTVGIGHGLPVRERAALRSVVLLSLAGAF